MHSVANARDRRRLTLAVAMAACALAAPAGATIFKCEGPDGTPVYQDSACPAGKQLRDFDKDPPTMSVMPLGPAPGTSTHQTLPAAPPAAPAKAKTTTKAKQAAQFPGRAADRRLLAPGINEGEVITRIGPPDMKSGGSGRKTARWTYLPVPDDPATLTTLTFENGRLVEVERKVVK